MAAGVTQDLLTVEKALVEPCWLVTVAATDETNRSSDSALSMDGKSKACIFPPAFSLVARILPGCTPA